MAGLVRASRRPDALIVEGLVFAERLAQTRGESFARIPAAQDREVFLRGDESEFEQHRGHRREAQDREIVLIYAIALAERASLKFLVHYLGEEQALLAVGVVHQMQEDVGFGVVGVEALIGGGVVILEQDHLILALAHLHIICIGILALVRGAQQVHGVAVYRSGAVGSVYVDRDEDIRVIFCGELGPVYQRYISVVAAGQQHFHIRAGLLYILFQAFRDVQDESFFLALAVLADGSRILAAVPGVDHYGMQSGHGGILGADARSEYGKKQRSERGTELDRVQNHIRSW